MQDLFSNDTIQLLLNHRSIRKYKDEPVTTEALNLIVRSAQQASSSSHMQAYSIIRVTDHDTRQAIAALSGGQRHVERAPEFLVWCADLNRYGQTVELAGGVFQPLLEDFLVAAVDVALAAQNAVVAAESLGYGAVYIGGIRNAVAEVGQLLGLPELVFPVFGLCIGVPDERPDVRPRLPLSTVYFENRYDAQAIGTEIEGYDQAYQSYAAMRSGGTKDTTWSKEMLRKASASPRNYDAYLNKQGFRLDNDPNHS